MSEHTALFGPSALTDDLVLNRVTPAPGGGRWVRFQQAVRGVPVVGGQVAVRSGPDGRLLSLTARSYPVPEALAVVPTFRAAAAIAAASLDFLSLDRPRLSDINGPPEVTANPELVVLPYEGDYRLVWRFSLGARGGYSYAVDAHSGRIVARRPAASHGGDRPDGTGPVYRAFPGPGAFSLTSETLRRLDGSGFLRGAYADVVNANGPRYQDASLNYTSLGPSDDALDEVNAYYHVDRVRADYFNGLGFGSHPSTIGQIDVEVNAIGPANGSFYPGQNLIEFAQPVDALRPSREAQIIYHEYAHAVTYAVVGASFNSGEPRAVDEGLSDYFAAAFVGEQRTPGDDPALFDEYGSIGNSRDITNPTYQTYSQYTSAPDLYEGAELFSHILWTAGGGGPGVDGVVFDALDGAGPATTFEGFRDLMLTASTSSATDNAIQTAFADHGIWDQPNQPPSPPPTSRSPAPSAGTPR